MKDYFIEIKTTFKTLKIAENILKILLQDKLVACAQISKISSHYVFENKLINQKEILLTLKTKKSLYPKIKKAIINHHEYKIPQIIFQKIDGGLDSYLRWVEASFK